MLGGGAALPAYTIFGKYMSLMGAVVGHRVQVYVQVKLLTLWLHKPIPLCFCKNIRSCTYIPFPCIRYICYICIMGYYIEVKMDIKLSSYLPPKIREFLDKVINHHDIGIEGIFHSWDVPVPDMDHDFFKQSDWYKLLIFTDFGGTNGSSFQNNVLSIHTSSKSQYETIDLFVDWISPYVMGRKMKNYLGWYKGDNDEHPINIYSEPTYRG